MGRIEKANFLKEIVKFKQYFCAEQVTTFSLAKGVQDFMKLVGTSCWYKLAAVLSCFVFTTPHILVLEQIILVISY